jgi:transposase-like protein
MARRYTREFKVSAVKLVNEQGYSVGAAAKSLGVDPGCVRDWVKRLGSGAAAVAAGLAPSGAGAMAAELARLRQENARLRTEREILKKAAAFFAREQP